MARRLGAWFVACATALVILGASIAPFLSPAYVRLEQDRVGVASLTGFSPAELDTVTKALLSDLVLWRSDFAVTVDGSPVLNEREQAHMRDVRGVFAGVFALVAFGLVVLILAARRAMRAGTDARFALWRAVGGGARALAIAIAVGGAFAILAFDAAFELFHRLFFSAGSYTFDPRTDRLVQLFPEQFWSETAIAVGAVMLVVAGLTAWLAGRRAAQSAAGAALTTAPRATVRSS